MSSKYLVGEEARGWVECDRKRHWGKSGERLKQKKQGIWESKIKRRAYWAETDGEKEKEIKPSENEAVETETLWKKDENVMQAQIITMWLRRESVAVTCTASVCVCCSKCVSELTSWHWVGPHWLGKSIGQQVATLGHPDIQSQYSTEGCHRDGWPCMCVCVYMHVCQCQSVSCQCVFRWNCVSEWR